MNKKQSELTKFKSALKRTVVKRQMLRRGLTYFKLETVEVDYEIVNNEVLYKIFLNGLYFEFYHGYGKSNFNRPEFLNYCNRKRYYGLGIPNEKLMNASSSWINPQFRYIEPLWVLGEVLEKRKYEMRLLEKELKSDGNK